MKLITIISLGLVWGSQISNAPSDIIIKEMFSDYNDLLAFGLTSKQNFKIVEPILNITRDCELSNENTWPKVTFAPLSPISNECLLLLGRYSYLLTSIKISEELDSMAHIMTQIPPSSCTFILEIGIHSKYTDQFLFASLLDALKGRTVELILNFILPENARDLGARLNSPDWNLVGLQLNRYRANRDNTIDNYIFQGLPGSKIKHFKYVPNQNEAYGVSLLASVLNQTVIESLQLGFQFIDDRCEEPLYRAISQTPSIKKLIFGHLSTGNSLRFMPVYLPMSNVSDLDLFGMGNGLGSPGFEHLLKTIELATKLRRLNLRSAELFGANAFAECLAKSQITHLGFLNSFLDTEALESLGAGFNNTKVTSFVCNACDLSYMRFISLKNALGNSNLQTLEITNVKNIGIEALFPILSRMPSLTAVNFSNTKVNVAMVRQLALVLPLTNIKNLDLSGNAFGEEGGMVLAGVLGQTKVEDLNLDGCDISPGARRALREAKPSMRLVLKLGWSEGGAIDSESGDVDYVATGGTRRIRPVGVAGGEGCFNCVIA